MMTREIDYEGDEDKAAWRDQTQLNVQVRTHTIIFDYSITLWICFFSSRFFLC